jgi:hypothetical protein
MAKKNELELTEEKATPGAKSGEQLPQEPEAKKANGSIEEAPQELKKMQAREWTDEEVIEHIMAGGRMLDQMASFDIKELTEMLKKWEKPNMAALVGATIVGVAESPEGAIGVIVVDTDKITKTVAWFTKEPMNPEPGFAFFTPYHK